MRDSLDVVVARHNEDISWVYGIEAKHRLFIYDKGELSHCRPLPNVGRESHTYAYHISRNYDNLADWTFFTQGRIEDHCGIWKELIEDYDSHCGRKFVGINTQYGEFIFCDSSGNPYWSGANLDQYCIDLKICEPQGRYNFVPGAIFIVHKSLILSRSRTFWYNVCDKAAEDPSGYHLERLWVYLLNAHKEQNVSELFR